MALSRLLDADPSLQRADSTRAASCGPSARRDNPRTPFLNRSRQAYAAAFPNSSGTPVGSVGIDHAASGWVHHVVEIECRARTPRASGHPRLSWDGYGTVSRHAAWPRYLQSLPRWSELAAVG